jgi:hypothetical protein
MIEVQSGEYLSEDDIIHFDYRYGGLSNQSPYNLL